jgi:hypothetical protein
MLEGAVLFCEGSPPAIAAAFDSVAGEIGYTRSTTPADLDIDVVASERGVAFSGELPKTFALALARKLARRLRQRVRVLTARLVTADNQGNEIECDVDDLTVTPEGASKPGRWAEDAIQEYGADWGQICDGKPYFAVSSLLEHARDTVLAGGEAQASMHLRAPPSLGSSRLDDIAKQVRLADRATLANVGGRACVRITTAGTTVTSFFEPADAEALLRAIGGLLAKT